MHKNFTGGGNTFLVTVYENNVMNVLSESFNLELHLGCSAGSNITGIS
jgi:peptidase E